MSRLTACDASQAASSYVDLSSCSCAWKDKRRHQEDSRRRATVHDARAWKTWPSTSILPLLEHLNNTVITLEQSRRRRQHPNLQPMEPPDRLPNHVLVTHVEDERAGVS